MKRIIYGVLLVLFVAGISYADLALMPNARVHFDDSVGKPLSGGKVCTYAAGTSTLKATYLDSAGTTTNTNPIVLNTRGEAVIYLDGSYKIKVMEKSQTSCTTGTAIYTQDNVSSMPYTNPADFVTNEWITAGAVATYISTTRFSVPGDFTTTYQIGRRIKAVATAGTLYGRVTAASYGSSITTVSVSLDSGSLDTGISGSDVNVSLMQVTSPSLSIDMISSGTNTANVNAYGIWTFHGTVSDLTGTQRVYTSPTRTFNTVYQNTTGKMMMVSVTGRSDSLAAVYAAYSDSSNPPTTVIALSNQYVVSYYLQLFFCVAPGNYYKVRFDAGTPSLAYWTEWY